MHQTSMECSCQGADPDGDFDELECLEDVGEYTLAVHEGWRGDDAQLARSEHHLSLEDCLADGAAGEGAASAVSS